MPIAGQQQRLIEEQLGTTIIRQQACAGGSINQSFQIQTKNGNCFFLKARPGCPADFFQAEVAGLNALRKTTSLRVPQVILTGQDFLLLEWLHPDPAASPNSSKLASGLATLHESAAPAFGFLCDNYCGSTPQANPRYENGHLFFAEQRLLPQARMALDNGYLNQRDVEQLTALCTRLPDLIPAQTPALLHGDLWSGNVLSDSDGEPALIDPACYWGWPEADLAMMQLFGGFDNAVLERYQKLRPLPQGFHERMPIYNLYHLLNHLNLFGTAYREAVRQILRRF